MAGPRTTAPHMISVITDCGFNIVSVAGNHAMDWGAEALLDTLDLLRAKGIQAIGAGHNLAEARQPALINAKGLRVAMLAYCSVLHEGYAAGPDTPGVAPMRATARFEPVDYQPGVSPRGSSRRQTSRLADLVADVLVAKEQADAVVLSLHSGGPFRAARRRGLSPHRGLGGVSGECRPDPRPPRMCRRPAKSSAGRRAFTASVIFIMSSSPKVTGGAGAFQRNYGVPLDHEYPNIQDFRPQLGIDQRRQVVGHG
jgi:hypothetical protein